MGWTKTARREHDRSGLRHASDCTDGEWAVVRPLLRRTTKVGRPREHKARTLRDAIQYIKSGKECITNWGQPGRHRVVRQRSLMLTALPEIPASDAGTRFRARH